MGNWRAPTKKDRDGLARNETERAPCCGRKTSADMLTDVSGHPAHMRWKGADYICDGCRERLFAEGACTREEFYAAFKPPVAALIRVAAFAFMHGKKGTDE